MTLYVRLPACLWRKSLHDFKPGDAVMLQVGGPAMVVESAARRLVTTVWALDSGEVMRGEFSCVVLRESR